MSMSSPNQQVTNGRLATGKFVFSVIQMVGPSVLALIVGYGSVMATRERDNQRLLTVENKMAELQRQIERDREHEVTREEMAAYLAGITRTLDSIQEDVRVLRRNR